MLKNASSTTKKRKKICTQKIPIQIYTYQRVLVFRLGVLSLTLLPKMSPRLYHRRSLCGSTTHKRRALNRNARCSKDTTNAGRFVVVDSLVRRSTRKTFFLKRAATIFCFTFFCDALTALVYTRNLSLSLSLSLSRVGIFFVFRTHKCRVPCLVYHH